MADILIREVDPHTIELLRQHAERRGKSLEAYLREALETLAREEIENPDDAEPFGSWAVRISRPGYAEMLGRGRQSLRRDLAGSDPPAQSSSGTNKPLAVA